MGRPAGRKAKTKAAPAKDSSFNKCIRCEKMFSSRQALKQHSKLHTTELKAIRMLAEGHIPAESKLGAEFKGKNKIIIS